MDGTVKIHLVLLCCSSTRCFASYFLYNRLYICGTGHDRVLTTVCTMTTEAHRSRRRRMVHSCCANTPPSKYIRVRFHCAKTYVQCVSVPGQTVKVQNSSLKIMQPLPHTRNLKFMKITSGPGTNGD